MADLQGTIGQVIRRERAFRQMTMKDLAERANISLVYLGEIERGKKYPSSIVIERLAEALDMEVYDLLQLVAEDLRAEAQPVERVIGFAPRGASRPEARVRASGPSRVVNLLPPVPFVTVAPRHLSQSAQPLQPSQEGQLPTITVLRDLCGSVA